MAFGGGVEFRDDDDGFADVVAVPASCFFVGGFDFPGRHFHHPGAVFGFADAAGAVEPGDGGDVAAEGGCQHDGVDAELEGASCAGDGALGFAVAGEVGNVEAADFRHPGEVGAHVVDGDVATGVGDELADGGREFPQVGADPFEDGAGDIRGGSHVVAPEFVGHELPALAGVEFRGVVNHPEFAERLDHVFCAPFAGVLDDHVDAGLVVAGGEEEGVVGVFDGVFGVSDYQDAFFTKQAGAEVHGHLAFGKVAGPHGNNPHGPGVGAGFFDGIDDVAAGAFGEEVVFTEDEVHGRRLVHAPTIARPGQAAPSQNSPKLQNLPSAACCVPSRYKATCPSRSGKSTGVPSGRVLGRSRGEPCGSCTTSTCVPGGGW